ncbi:hypothetical protein KTT_46620 [Tengunoibacter tsumagoiensis]|uniref:Uncharacterized protein n=1 Tax=Tengunoibacter tsumagoiensis TaxID=2014871 RepID=A0A402A6N0_9CHLR|nr:hypothetical protein KTT_46620 [Tengunoibacter tsumagoiensis]
MHQERFCTRSQKQSFAWPMKSRKLYYRGAWLVHQALEAFYATRQVPYDQQLYLHSDSFGYSRLQSHGIDYQAQRTMAQVAEKLEIYQQEMQDFTTFLKYTYLPIDAR